MYQRIKNALREGKTVVHDTGNFTKYERQLARKIADKLGLESRTIFVNTPVDLAKDRLLKNQHTKERFDVDEKDFYSTHEFRSCHPGLWRTKSDRG